ncbi:uncharacterized protein LOC109833705 isoform X2 [Asparagus officinalis]|uniref:uncharacterized protein LOC109833705 isoform X2 n=1 Tax=Asparagus officinalis TaxID=4686 RepID=UPI00098E3B8C|nr:uncharacterized protein LOC109833705 isoform X2 [Asparagus officinalis]
MNRQQQGVGNVFSLWEQRRRFAAVYVICLVVNWLMRRRIRRRDHIDRPIMRSDDERKKAREELIHHVKTSTRARALVRMGPETFNNLCDILRAHGGLTSTRLSSVEEQVITFLNILGVNQLNRTLQCYFRRSGETVSRHFHRVLRAMILLEEIFLQQPDGSEVPPEIANNTRFWPYFKDCVGAIGGTHIRVKVSTLLASRYRDMGKRNSVGSGWMESLDESKRDKLQWTEKMDECLIDALLHQQTIGNRVDGTWTCVALSNVSKELTEKLEMDINKDRVKNRMKTIKQNFNSCFDLFKNFSGFAWCPTTSMWMAEREAWEPLLKANPNASKFMKYPFHNYDKMLQLFANDRATGEGAMTAKEKRRRLQNSTNMGQDQWISLCLTFSWDAIWN